MKNRYVGRTFIMPQQGMRKKSVRQKLAPIRSELHGRNVLLVDDSIVRGTTAKEIVQMAREAGALRVYMASAAPPVKYPNVYGIDMPTTAELIASSKGVDETQEQIEARVARAIGADHVIYQRLEDLTELVVHEAAESGVHELQQLDCSCFNGEYVTAAAVSTDYLTQLAATRTSDRGHKASPIHVLDRLEAPPQKKVCLGLSTRGDVAEGA